MPNPGLPKSVIVETIETIEDFLRRGYAPPNLSRNNVPGAKREAARKLNISESTVGGRLMLAETKHGLSVDWSLYTPPELTKVQSRKLKPKVRIKTTTDVDASPMYRVLAVGDLHDSPTLPDKSRFNWIGHYANRHQIPHIVQIGDWMSCDSCSQYDSRATITGRQKPSFDEDIASLEISISAMVSEFDADYSPHRVITLGNHENRAYQWEDNNPEVEGMFALRMEQSFSRGGFDFIPYMDWYFLGGVGFTHVPTGVMGKPYGGEQPENAIANKAVFSIVYGHTHKRVLKRAAKIGPQKHVTVLNLGCALPDGHLEHYLKTDK